MKIPLLRLLSILFVSTIATTFAQETPAPVILDLGDGTSLAIISKAWQGIESKNYAVAEAYAAKCTEKYTTQAIEQQKALTAPPTEKEQVYAQWALNDVGTCYFIRGQALEKLGKNKEAIESYTFLVTNLPFAQCWDPKGWFWKPASAAAERIKALEFDAL